MTHVAEQGGEGRNDLLATVQSLRASERRLKSWTRHGSHAAAIAVLVIGIGVFWLVLSKSFDEPAFSTSFLTLYLIGVVVLAIAARAVVVALAAPSVRSARAATARAESQLYAWDAAQQYRSSGEH